jgi:hypothetical protein
MEDDGDEEDETRIVMGLGWGHWVSEWGIFAPLLRRDAFLSSQLRL